MSKLEQVYPDLADSEVYAQAILNRPLVAFPGDTLRQAVAGRRILITGAGGFIGSGLARLAASLNAAHLTLLDNGEHNLYSIDAEMAARWTRQSWRSVLCDVRDGPAVHRCLADERPDIVFHAAALKQLPLLEDHAREAILTNFIGARNVADAAAAAGSSVVALISTDKAVHPVSVLGVTKKLAEGLFRAMDVASATTRFVAVRFGNVFGSTGSVVPLFRRQIAAREPVTITAPGIGRYFMTLGEASQLLLHVAARTSAAGPRGASYLLSTGAPVEIETVARRLASHHAPDWSLPIRYTGLRPGERMAECLVHAGEGAEPTELPAVQRLTSHTLPVELVRRQADALVQACAAGDEARLRELLDRYDPDFAALGPTVLRAAESPR